MPIEFSEHAEFQIKKRKISKKRIAETIKEPDESIPSYKTRRLRRKSYSGKILQVVTITEGSKITIISAYYLRRQ